MATFTEAWLDAHPELTELAARLMAEARPEIERVLTREFGAMADEIFFDLNTETRVIRDPSSAVLVIPELFTRGFTSKQLGSDAGLIVEFQLDIENEDSVLSGTPVVSAINGRTWMTSRKLELIDFDLLAQLLDS